MTTANYETVNLPNHYDLGNGYQVADVSGALPGNLAQALQYLWRTKAGKPGTDPHEDYRKALRFLELEMRDADFARAESALSRMIAADLNPVRRVLYSLIFNAYSCPDWNMSRCYLFEAVEKLRDHITRLEHAEVDGRITHLNESDFEPVSADKMPQDRCASGSNPNSSEGANAENKS